MTFPTMGTLHPALQSTQIEFRPLGEKHYHCFVRNISSPPLLPCSLLPSSLPPSFRPSFLPPFLSSSLPLFPSLPSAHLFTVYNIYIYNVVQKIQDHLRVSFLEAFHLPPPFLRSLIASYTSKKETHACMYGLVHIIAAKSKTYASYACLYAFETMSSTSQECSGKRWPPLHVPFAACQSFAG